MRVTHRHGWSTHLGCKQIDNAIFHPWKRHRSEEKDDQHDIRVDGRNVNNDRILRDAFDDANVD